jgi:hypothetical protein
LRTSREFFLGKTRPSGYIAEGRALSFRTYDTNATGHSFMMLDPWVASIDTSKPLALVERDTTRRIIASLDTARALLRTRYFTAGDSTWFGVILGATMHGDTTGMSGTHVTYVVELIDSASGQRVHLLDSFRISTTYRQHNVVVKDSLDLLSGTYFIRARVDTVGMQVPPTATDSRYPIGELRMDVPESGALYKVRRMRPAHVPLMRVTAHPNPVQSVTEARFTVTTPGRVRVVLSDYGGTDATTLVDEWMEAGRYAVDVDVRRLTSGIYLLQVSTDDETGVAKLLVSP